MDKEMLKDLEKLGRIQPDSKTWVHPWITYWHWWVSENRDEVIKEFSEKYKNYHFYKAEAHINNVIYEIINIDEKNEKV